MSFGSHEVLRADYILNYKDAGLSAATRADTALRESVKKTASTVGRAGETIDRMSARQATAWKRAASVAAESQRRVAEGQYQSSRKVDSAVQGTVDRLRKQGLAYEEVVKYMQRYRVDAEQTARAIETAAKKEIAATDRVLASQKRLSDFGGRMKTRVGFGSASAIHPLSSARAVGGRVRGALSGGAGLLAGGVLGFVSVEGIKSAAEGTTQLLQNAEALHKFAGLSQQTALSFTAVAQAYGVSSTKLGMTFRTLGTAVNTQLTKPTASSAKAFKDLGITQNELRAHQHDLSGLFGLIADKLNKLPAGAAKTADASHLLGRSWQSLVPLIASGSKGMDTQLASAKALGVELGGNSSENVAKLHAAMINLKVAQIGMQVQFTEHILPALLKFVNFGLKAYAFLRQQFAPVFHFLGSAIHAASGFLKTHTALLGVLKTGVVGLVAAFAGLKVISFTTRLFRGLAADVKVGYNAFKTLLSPVDAVKSLFGKNLSAEEKLMAANAQLAESNARLATSYEEVATAAGAAAERQALASEAGAGGMVPMAGGAARTAETAGLGAAETEASAIRQYGPIAGAYGPQGGRVVASAAAERAVATEAGTLTTAEAGSTGLLAKAGGLGSGLLRGGMIAGGGLLAVQMGLPMLAHLTGMSRGTQGALGAIGTGASVGAGVGSIIPGVGTLIGGVVGAGVGGLIHGLTTGGIVNQATSTAAYKDALRSGKTFGDALQAGERALNAQASGQKFLVDVQKKINKAGSGTLQNLQTRLDASEKDHGITSRQASAAQRAITTRGLQLAAPKLQATMQGIATSKFAPNATQIFQATTADLFKLPQTAQDLGAEAMVKFAAGMEAKKKLPKGTTNELIGDLEALYGPKLSAMLGQAGADSMQAFIDSVQTSKVLGVVQGQVDGIHKKWATVIPATKLTTDNLVGVVGNDMSKLRGIIANSTGKQRDEAIAAYQALKWNATRTLGSMTTTLIAQQQGLRKGIASNSAQAKTAATNNFLKMAGNISGAVGSGVEATGAGISQITKALNATLSAFGGKPIPGVAGVGISVMKAVSGITGIVKGAVSKFAATGARVPGAVGPDNWMLVDPSGRPAAMVGGGEILVANRHTESRIDEMLAPYGTSLDREVAAESRMHSFARGGRTPRAALGLSGSRPNSGYASTGSVVLDSGVNMSVGQEPTILSDLRRLANELHQTVYVISGYRSPAHSVAVGGFANDPHTQGAAADIGIGSPSRASMLGVSEGQLNAVGLYRPYYPASAAEVNHVQLLAGGARGAGGAGARGGLGAIPQIKVPSVKGSGTMATLTRLGFAKLAAAANAKIARLGGGVSTAGLSGSLIAMVKQISAREGWGPGQVQDWLNVIQQESGGSMTATNPSSGAYGIAQGISGPSWYAAHGGNANTQSGQLVAMANYIAQRYGNPAAAWAHEQSSNWYARGGRIGANRGARIDPPGTVQSAEKRALAAMRATHAKIVYAAPPKKDPMAKGVKPGKAASAFRVNASSEVVGGQGAFGFSPGASSGGRGYSILSGSGLSSDPGPYGIALGPGKWKPPSPLIFKRGSRRSGPATLQDIGAGDNSRPTIGLYPTTIRELGGQEGSDLSGVEIERADKKAFTALRAASVASFRYGGRLTAQHGRRLRHHVHTDRPRHLRHHHHRTIPRASGFTTNQDYARDPNEPYYRITRIAQILHEVPVLTSPEDYGVEPEHPGQRQVRGIAATGYHIQTNLRTIRATHDPRRFKRALAALGHEVGRVEDVSYKQLTGIGNRIRKEITQTSAFKHPDAVRRIEAELRNTAKGTDRAKKLVGELRTARESVAQEARLQAALKEVDKAERKRVSTLVGHAQAQAAALTGAQTRLQRMMVRRDIDSSSRQGSEMLLKFDDRAVKVLRNTVASLRKAEALAKKAHDPKQAAAIRAKLKTALDSLDQAITDKMQARMDLVTNTAASIVSRTQARDTGLQTAQDLASLPGGGAYARIVAGAEGVKGPVYAAGTANAAAQSEALIQQNVNALGGELVQLQAKYANAHSAAMKKTIKEAIESTGQALAQAAEELRTAIEGAAQQAVDVASHATTMATTGEEHLSLLQQLQGTSGTPLGATQMAAYIRSNVIPALQGELTALQDQRTTALQEGDPTLARQIAEEIGGKQNDILQAQLDAQNAIKAATQATEQELSQLSGATGFEYAGQQFTDAIAANVGA